MRASNSTFMLHTSLNTTNIAFLLLSILHFTVSMETCVIATRGMHGPAWSEADEMAGTTGVYVELDGSTLITGANALGAVQFNLADGDAPPFEPNNFDVPVSPSDCIKSI